MKYEININEFQGPLDLLLHLIKKENISIYEISIDKIAKQYLDYINSMKALNLDIASEYLVMAAELLEMKSSSLLPNDNENDDDYEENPKEQLINKLLEYEKYKNMVDTFKDLEEYRSEIYTKTPDSLIDYKAEEENINYGVNLNDLINAINNFLNEKEMSKPLNTKITNKEYSVTKRSHEIRNILKAKKKIKFFDLFEIITKEYVVITFLSILAMTRNHEIIIEQENNFKDIIIKEKGVI